MSEDREPVQGIGLASQSAFGWRLPHFGKEEAERNGQL